VFCPWENAGTFYLPCINFFANFEFIFAIRGLKLAKRIINHEINMAQKRGAFFLHSPRAKPPQIAHCTIIDSTLGSLSVKDLQGESTH